MIKKVNKSSQEIFNDSLRKELIEFLIVNGYPNLVFNESQSAAYNIDDNIIRNATNLFLNTLNIHSGSTPDFHFNKLAVNYINDLTLRRKINELLVDYN